MCATDSNGRRFIAYCLIAATTMCGCSTAPTQLPDDTAPPDIPPTSTIVMDFSDFQNQESAKRGELRVVSADNWGWAALNVSVWNTILTVTLAVPVAAFVESFNHDPVQQADGSWEWSYDVDVASVTYTAALQAQTVDGDVQWDMFLSKEGEFTNVHWFSGVSNLVATEGTWTLNRDPDNVTPFIGIEWHRNTNDETADIKYTNIIPDDPENGGFIFYAITNDVPDDAKYTLFNKGQDNLTEIEWSRDDKSGRVTDPLHFGDDAWHCWSALLQDTDCEETPDGP